MPDKLTLGTIEQNGLHFALNPLTEIQENALFGRLDCVKKYFQKIYNSFFKNSLYIDHGEPVKDGWRSRHVEQQDFNQLIFELVSENADADLIKKLLKLRDTPRDISRELLGLIPENDEVLLRQLASLKGKYFETLKYILKTNPGLIKKLTELRKVQNQVVEPPHPNLPEIKNLLKLSTRQKTLYNIEALIERTLCKRPVTYLSPKLSHLLPVRVVTTLTEQEYKRSKELAPIIEALTLAIGYVEGDVLGPDCRAQVNVEQLREDLEVLSHHNSRLVREKAFSLLSSIDGIDTQGLLSLIYGVYKPGKEVCLPKLLVLVNKEKPVDLDAKEPSSERVYRGLSVTTEKDSEAREAFKANRKVDQRLVDLILGDENLILEEVKQSQAFQKASIYMRHIVLTFWDDREKLKSNMINCLLGRPLDTEVRESTKFGLGHLDGTLVAIPAEKSNFPKLSHLRDKLGGVDALNTIWEQFNIALRGFYPEGGITDIDSLLRAKLITLSQDQLRTIVEDCIKNHASPELVFELLSKRGENPIMAYEIWEIILNFMQGSQTPRSQEVASSNGLSLRFAFSADLEPKVRVLKPLSDALLEVIQPDLGENNLVLAENLEGNVDIEKLRIYLEDFIEFHVLEEECRELLSKIPEDGVLSKRQVIEFIQSKIDPNHGPALICQKTISPSKQSLTYYIIMSVFICAGIAIFVSSLILAWDIYLVMLGFGLIINCIIAIGKYYYSERKKTPTEREVEGKKTTESSVAAKEDRNINHIIDKAKYAIRLIFRNTTDDNCKTSAAQITIAISMCVDKISSSKQGLVKYAKKTLPLLTAAEGFWLEILKDPNLSPEQKEAIHRYSLAKKLLETLTCQPLEEEIAKILSKEIQEASSDLIRLFTNQIEDQDALSKALSIARAYKDLFFRKVDYFYKDRFLQPAILDAIDHIMAAGQFPKPLTEDFKDRPEIEVTKTLLKTIESLKNSANDLEHILMLVNLAINALLTLDPIKDKKLIRKATDMLREALSNAPQLLPIKQQLKEHNLEKAKQLIKNLYANLAHLGVTIPQSPLAQENRDASSDIEIELTPLSVAPVVSQSTDVMINLAKTQLYLEEAKDVLQDIKLKAEQPVDHYTITIIAEQIATLREKLATLSGAAARVSLGDQVGSTLYARELMQIAYNTEMAEILLIQATNYADQIEISIHQSKFNQKRDAFIELKGYLTTKENEKEQERLNAKLEEHKKLAGKLARAYEETRRSVPSI